jgi:sterol desaturase/sphingolipid hydroxylase (fatty acid hydroxylase superfamily)
MTTSFFVIWVLLLAVDSLLIRWLEKAVHRPEYAKYRIRTPTSYEIPARRRAINTSLNGLFALSIFVAFFALLGRRALYVGLPPSIPAFIGETLGVLLLYDFMYYFLHRFMHHRRVMDHVHRIHHMVRFPTARESSFLHPAETFAGIALLLLAVVLLGPISGTSFLVVYAIHSIANIIVHGNLVLPHPVFRLTNFWAAKHDIHHHRMTHNYASLFPFWDQAFGTFR